MKKTLLTLLMLTAILAALVVPAAAEMGTETLSTGTYYIVAYKFYDANVNGLYDPGEKFINNWKLELLDVQGTVVDTQYTSGNGRVDFRNLSGTYTVREVMPVESCWFQTTPVPIAIDRYVFKFGNVCLGAGGGLTPGFWSNNNGRILGTDDLGLLVGLNLKNTDGSDFDPVSYTEFSDWLRTGKADNMARMLSVQLAAMKLSVENGKVSGNAMIYAPGTQSANRIGFASVEALMAEANAELGSHSLTLSGSEFRGYQEALKNALDNANNNLTFVQAAPCPFTYPVPVV